MPLPEESVSGYLLRRCMIEGEDPKQLRSAVVGRFPTLTAEFFGWRVVPRLTNRNWRSVKRFSESQAQRLAADHSIAAIYRPTTHRNIVFAMGRLFERRALKESEFESSGLKCIKYRPSYARVRFCPSCFHEQISEFGAAYFRRAWTVPYISNCLIHGERLLGVGCPCCGGNDGVADLSRNLVQYCPQCGTDLWSSSAAHPSTTSLLTDAWFEVLLKDPLPSLSSRTLDRCFQEAANRLNGKFLTETADHRCSRECDPFACTQRVRWMLDERGKVCGSSLTFYVNQGTNYLGIPPFLLFWLPIIHAFREVADLREFVSQNSPAVVSRGIAASIRFSRK